LRKDWRKVARITTDPGTPDAGALGDETTAEGDNTASDSDEPHYGMQLQYHAVEEVTTHIDLDTLQLTKSVKGNPARRRWRCSTLRFKKRLQPVLSHRIGEQTVARQRHLLQEMCEGRMSSVAARIQKEFPAIHELLRENEKTDVLIVKNAPRAAFADLLIVNNLTKELWLVQCKSFQTAPNVDWVAELTKMGHPDFTQQNHDAAQYREALMQALGMTTVRHFFCVFAASKIGSNPAKAAEAPKGDQEADGKENVFQPLPSDVFVLSNTFGFDFTPMALEYLNGDGAEAQELLEDEDLHLASALFKTDFESIGSV
jgi:hypothetical protein